MTEPQILEILKDNNPLLRGISSEIASVNDEIRTLASNMIETMKAANGIGLAAVQVGVPIRMIVVKTGSDCIVMVNPVIEWAKKLCVEMQEGCLSLPGRRIDISRPADIEVAFTDLDGNRQKLALGGMPARIVQHEIDHLDGILMPDRI